MGTAKGAQSVANPQSAVPMVGASGAISGVMGAYIVLYPRVRVHLLVILGFYIRKIAVPAYLMLGYWLLIQLVSGALAVGQESGGVAFRNNALVAEHRAHLLQHATTGYRLPWRRPRERHGEPLQRGGHGLAPTRALSSLNQLSTRTRSDSAEVNFRLIRKRWSSGLTLKRACSGSLS
jgi:rhomboid family protein